MRLIYDNNGVSVSFIYYKTHSIVAKKKKMTSDMERHTFFGTVNVSAIGISIFAGILNSWKNIALCVVRKGNTPLPFVLIHTPNLRCFLQCVAIYIKSDLPKKPCRCETLHK